jgi:hypothetical protein
MNMITLPPLYYPSYLTDSLTVAAR